MRRIATALCLLFGSFGVFARCNDTVEVKRAVARFAGGVAVNADITEILKSSVHELRPTGIDNHSFPSRHTSWAFAIATAGSRELFTLSPWAVTTLHAAASTVGVQRLFDMKHFPKDVAGGEFIGITSGLLGSWAVNRLFFGKSSCCTPSAEYSWMPSLSIVNKMLFPLAHGIHTGWCAEMRGSLPLSDRFGMAISLPFRSLPVYCTDSFAAMANSIGLSVGIVWQTEISDNSPWGLQTTFSPGIAFKAGNTYPENAIETPYISSLTLTMEATAALSYQLTSGLSVGVEAGYSYLNTAGATSALVLGFFTRTCF